MTPDEINRFLAIEVMDWSEAPFDMFPSKGVWFCPPDRKMTIDNCKQLPDFYHSIADAMRVVEKIGKAFKLERDSKGKWWGYVDDDRWHCSGNEDTPSAAICLAAVEWAKAKMASTPPPTEP